MDYTTPFIRWLLTCPYIKQNKVFINALQAQDNNIQIVTQQIARSQDKRYIDGSVLHRVVFTVFDYKSITFNQLVKSYVDRHENISDLLDAGQLIAWVEEQSKAHFYPNFGDGFEVQDIYTEYLSPSTPSVDNSMSPALARFSIPIICEVLEHGGWA